MTTLAAFNGASLLTASGVAVPANADVEVRRESDSVIASIFSDEAGTTGITQPGFQTDAQGRFIFYAAGILHGYKITITKGAESHVWRNVPIGTAAQLDVAAFVAAASYSYFGDRFMRRSRQFAALNLI